MPPFAESRWGRLLAAPLRRDAAAAVLIALFLLTRLFLFTGFPFSAAYLEQGVQVLDPGALQEDLQRSLLFSHFQPPLFNLFVGTVLKATPDRPAAEAVFALLYGAMGLFLVLGVFRLAQSLGATRGWALAGAALFSLWPPFTWSHRFNHPPAERWLSYDLPVTALLVAMALALARFRDRGGILPLSLFLLGGAVVALTRSMFHPVFWLVPVLALGAWAARRPGSRAPARAVVLLALLALLAAGSVPFRNWRLTGWFTPSTLEGMNLWALTLLIPSAEVDRAVAEGKVTPLAKVPRFSPPADYLAYYGDSGARTGVPVLDEAQKGGGQVNLNHFIIPRASREYRRNALELVRLHPLDAAKAVFNGVYIYFGFQPNQFLWETNQPPWGFWRLYFPPFRPEGAFWPVRYILLPLLFFLAYAAVGGFLARGQAGRGGDPLRLFFAFALAYVLAVSCTELGINCVFRQQVDPFLFAGGAALLGGGVRWRRG